LSQECYNLNILSFLFCFSQQLYFSESKCKDEKFLSCTQVHIVTSVSCVTRSDEWHGKVDLQRELPLSMLDASEAVGFRERDAFLSPTSGFWSWKLCVWDIYLWPLGSNEKTIMCFWLAFWKIQLLEHCSTVLLIMKLQAGWLMNVPLATMLVLLSHCCKLTRCLQGIGALKPYPLCKPLFDLGLCSCLQRGKWNEKKLMFTSLL
jgi:hypothetical protein